MLNCNVQLCFSFFNNVQLCVFYYGSYNFTYLVLIIFSLYCSLYFQFQIKWLLKLIYQVMFPMREFG